MAAKTRVLDRDDVLISELKPHPRNYQSHTPAQIAELVAAIRAVGFTRSVVLAKDKTILAGHGAVEAAAVLGLTHVPTVRLSCTPSSAAALKVLTGDNELARMATRDERALTQLLEDIGALDPAGLLGTGIDEAAHNKLLTGLLDAGTNPWEEWKNLPDYESEHIESAVKVFVHFKTEADADAFFELIERPRKRSLWWPVDEEQRNVSAVDGEAWVAE